MFLIVSADNLNFLPEDTKRTWSVPVVCSYLLSTNRCMEQYNFNGR